MVPRAPELSATTDRRTISTVGYTPYSPSTMTRSAQRSRGCSEQVAATARGTNRTVARTSSRAKRISVPLGTPRVVGVAIRSRPPRLEFPLPAQTVLLTGRTITERTTASAQVRRSHLESRG